jgi:hypothetical protein
LVCGETALKVKFGTNIRPVEKRPLKIKIGMLCKPFVLNALQVQSKLAHNVLFEVFNEAPFQ